jgi:hypothetical protein
MTRDGRDEKEDAASRREMEAKAGIEERNDSYSALVL